MNYLYQVCKTMQHMQRTLYNGPGSGSSAVCAEDKNQLAIACENQQLPLSFLRKHINDLEMPWELISRHQRITEEIANEFVDVLIWKEISMYQIDLIKNCSDDFLRMHKNRLDWGYISAIRDMTEDAIEEFSKYVHWTLISWEQNISVEFFIKHIDKLDMYFLSMNVKLKDVLEDVNYHGPLGPRLPIYSKPEVGIHAPMALSQMVSFHGSTAEPSFRVARPGVENDRLFT